MKKPAPKNLAASVHHRLLEKAKESNRTFNELLLYFGIERFLYRLSCSPHAKTFVLKGALMLTVWKIHASRSTKDIDLMGKMPNDPGKVEDVFKRICKQPCVADGLEFDPSTVNCQPIIEDAEYRGLRVQFTGYLGNARIPMQIDIGFGDQVHPLPVRESYPTLLDFPAPELNTYTRESAVAEKFHAMVKRGMLNSRMKDFFDIYMLAKQFSFSGKVLADAVSRTFETRHTELPEEPVAFSRAFMADTAKQAQWRGFIRKARAQGIPQDFGTVVTAVSDLLLPVSVAVARHAPFSGTWEPPGPWQYPKVQP
ncbi:MAG: hypothetical protein AMXMBFR7_50650 [Planctomycetota bacterium]